MDYRGFRIRIANVRGGYVARAQSLFDKNTFFKTREYSNQAKAEVAARDEIDKIAPKKMAK